MENYVNYDYYVTQYWGKTVPEDEFHFYSTKASRYIRYLTAGKADGLDLDEIKDAACAACEAYYQFDNRDPEGAVVGKIVSSENTDGYSVSYATEGSSGNTYEEIANQKAYKAIYPHLAFTGLMNRRVDNAHKYGCNTL